MRLPRPRSPLLPSLLTLLLVVLSTVPALAVVGGGENTECGAGYTFFTKFDDLGSSYEIGDVLGPQDGVTVTVTAIKVENDGDTTGEITGFTWESTTPIDKVILKAGTADTTVLYTDALSGGPIVSPINPTNQKPIGASHITFCTEDDGGGTPVPADLLVSKAVKGMRTPAGPFGFTATCGTATETFSLAAGETWSWNADGTGADLTAGVTCTVVETEDQDAKEVKATFNGATYVLGDTVTLVAGDNTVVVTNHLGGTGEHKADLIVTKVVTGNAVPDPLPTFAFTVTCGELTETFTLADGESWSWKDDSGEHHLRAKDGATCTVTETVPAGASASALLDGVAYTLGAPIVLVPGDNTVDVTNDYTTGGPTVADLVVTKAVAGNAAPAAGTLFGFSATCGAVTQTFSLAAGGTWSWNTDGTAPDLVAGATCAVSETASNGATSVAATFNTASYTLGQTVALVAGTNTVATVNTFTSTPNVSPEPQPQTQAPVLRPAIAVDKSADAASYTVGDVITYTYVITNVGETTLSSLTLVDDVLGDLSDEITVTSLAPGEATTVTVTTTASAVGELTNVGAVTGRSPSGELVVSDDVVTVAVAEVAGVVIVKPTPEPAPEPQPAPEPAPVPEEPEVAPVTEVAAQELPRTGAPGVELLALALLSLATGAVVLRLRRSDG